MQWTKQELNKLVSEDISKKEKLGNREGGSGHFAHISFQIDQIKSPVSTPQGWRIDYDYTLFTETEFTYYPDNPPYENKCSSSLYLKK